MAVKSVESRRNFEGILLVSLIVIVLVAWGAVLVYLTLLFL